MANTNKVKKKAYQDYDIGIIGAGIAGLNAAIHASKHGLKVVLFEKRDLGGLSLNGGDLLMNELYNSLAIYKRLKRRDKNITFDLNSVFLRMKRLKRNYLREYLKVFEHLESITFVKHNATLLDNQTILANNELYRVKNIVLAVGARSREYILNNGTKPDNYKNFLKVYNLMHLKKTPKTMVIVGGSAIAFEIAIFFSNIGTKTTVLARGDVLRTLDPDIKEVYLDNIKNNHLTIKENASVISMDDFSVTYLENGVTFKVPAEVFIPAIGFERTEVKVGDTLIPSNNQGILVNEFCETEIPHIYAIGNANHFAKFSNRAIAEAFTAVNHILGRKRVIDDHTYVRSITGLYEYALYGKNEMELIAKNVPYTKEVFYPSPINENYIIKMFKVLIHKYTHEVLGLFMVGTHLNEQMNTALMILDDSNRLDYISRTQVLSSAYLTAKILSDHIKDLDLEVIENHFHSFYQPKFDLKTQKVIGAESLARFYIDERYHNPLPFITNFERRGHIYEMDNKVLQNACQFINDLEYAGLLSDDFVISINIAPYTLSQISPERMLKFVTKYNVSPKHLMLEVPERNFEIGIDFLSPLKALKAMGFKISMDDFSVGHSSFALLNIFPFDEVKLDLGLLPKDENDVNQQVVYQNIINAVKTNDASLVAEGIETSFHHHFLLNNGITKGQGYFLSRPLPKEEFIKLLKKES